MAKAILKFIRVSPIKARLIAREVQGMNAEYAIASLQFTPNKAAGIISKVIASAVANAGLDPVDAVITSARVDKGPVLKRFTPRARGSASPKHRPTERVAIPGQTDLGRTGLPDAGGPWYFTDPLYRGIAVRTL